MDTTSTLAKNQFNSLSEPYPEYFTEDEISAILVGIYKTINVPFTKDQPVPKTVLVDLFGTQKAGKTSVTSKIEQVFRRNGFNAFCPPETAEIESVRNRLTNDPMVSQAIHLTGVQDYVLNLAHHPRMHLAILSRGLIDMLYWYERDRRKGNYTDEFVSVINRHIYELLRKDLVDAFVFFTCSVKAAMEREYADALTHKRGSKMNEKDVAETLNIYEIVLAEVNENVPGLPIFHVDTSDISLKETGQEVLRYLLPAVVRRFSVPSSAFLLQSPTLMRKNAKHAINFEEQLKLKGTPDAEKIKEMGWILQHGEYEQQDIYLRLGDNAGSDELLRIRKDYRGIGFGYKGPSRDRLLSHRNLQNFILTEVQAQEMSKMYPVVLVLNKIRQYYRLDPKATCDGHFFTLHLDKVDGLGDFTEIRAYGSSDNMHTQELFIMASRLGFNLTDIIEGSYLTLALANNKQA